jgi:hypothetical protein
MTRVRGKVPLKLNRVKEVHGNPYSLKVTVHVEGHDGAGEQFTAEGELEMHCAKNLIRDLRLAMRKVRDEAIAAVSDAEGPL